MSQTGATATSGVTWFTPAQLRLTTLVASGFATVLVFATWISIEGSIRHVSVTGWNCDQGKVAFIAGAAACLFAGFRKPLLSALCGLVGVGTVVWALIHVMQATIDSQARGNPLTVPIKLYSLPQPHTYSLGAGAIIAGLAFALFTSVATLWWIRERRAPAPEPSTSLDVNVST